MWHAATKQGIAPSVIIGLLNGPELKLELKSFAGFREETGMVEGAAPATSPAVILDPSGGSNQVRVRAYNERLVMSLVRRHGALSKAEIARRSGLSAQTVTVIMRALESDGLLIRGAPTRGKVGQPSTPMRLNPDAVYSFGVKIGRRSAELAVMDFVGKVRLQIRRIYAYPMPERARSSRSARARRRPTRHAWPR